MIDETMVEPEVTKQWTRKQMMKGLKEIVPQIQSVKKSESFLGKKGGIWISWETTLFYKRLPAFDCEVEDYGDETLSDVGVKDPVLKNMKINTIYVDGVNREIHNWLEDRGWYPKWFDKSTLFFFPYNVQGFGV